jgi:NAD+ kinase
MKILLVYKKSALDRGFKKSGFKNLQKINAKHLNNLIMAHDEHNKTLESVFEFLHREKIKHSFIDRSKINHKIKADLYISVGGDGTFLNTARYCSSQKILGINSSPSTSVGFFCKTKSDKFGKYIIDILNEKIKIRIRYERLGIRINEHEYQYPVLNDILFSHKLPAGLSRYIIQLKDEEEFQRSSGIWISTPAGSGAAFSNAGGKKISPVSEKFQFIIREPYFFTTKYKLLNRSFQGKHKLFLTSAINEGCLFIDGTIDQINLQIGDRAQFFRSKYPLDSY